MAKAIKILTWNIWNYNQWEARKPYLAECINEINADIVALQEVRTIIFKAQSSSERPKTLKDTRWRFNRRLLRLTIGKG